MPDVLDPNIDYGAPPLQAPAVAQAPAAPIAAPALQEEVRNGVQMTRIPTLYAPPAQTGPWNSSEFISEAFRRLPSDVALKAMEGAVQLEGMLGYDADIKAGIPTAQAIAKWAPKLWYKNPAAAMHAMQANAPAFQPEELVLPSGQKVIRMSPQRFAFSPKALRDELTPGEQIHSITAQMKGLEARIKAEIDPKKEALMWQEHNLLGQQLGDLRSKGHKASDTIKVRRKSDGKVFQYPAGRKSEVKGDYEVVE